MHPLFACVLLFFCPTVWAELRPLADAELGSVNGQDGISISASVKFNPNAHLTRCPGGCGARIAIKPGHSDGFILIDNLKGTFSFDGVTLDIVKIDSGFNGEGAQFDAEALKLGLREAHFADVQFTLAGANQASATQPGLQQTDLLTYRTNGAVNLQGDLYIFAAP
jgi:hypothetical protein